MMSSQSTHNLFNPAFRSKMPLFDGTVASNGLSKQANMSEYLGKPTMQYNGAYLTYDPRGRDAAQFTPPWSNSKTALVDGRSPVSHLSGMERENHIIYRQDNSPSEDSYTRTSSLGEVPVKKGFTLYTKSPATNSPVAATSMSVRKPKNGVDNSCPSSDRSFYLAIPKPIYGHSHCCDKLGCVIGQRYVCEHGALRMHDMMQVEPHSKERPPIQRKAEDTLLQQKDFQFDPNQEHLKRIPVEAYSPGRARIMPTLIEPNYTTYPCTLTPRIFGSLAEQSLQTSSRRYPSFYPSHHPYEHMTSEFYQEHSPMPKYGHLAQHPMFYYTRADVEVENRTQCKDIGSKQREVPVILKHTLSNPSERYVVPQPLHGQIPLPLANTEAFQSHSLKQDFGYPCFAYPRINLNASQIRPPIKRQHAIPIFHSNRIDVSPSRHCVDQPVENVPDPRKDKPNTITYVDHAPNTHSPFLGLEQTSPPRQASQPSISSPNLQMSAFFPPVGNLHVNRPVPSPAFMNVDRFPDYSSFESPFRYPKQRRSLPAFPAAWQAPSPNHGSGQSPNINNNSKVRKIVYSPPVNPASVNDGPKSSSSSAILKGCLMKSISHSPIEVKKEDRDLCDVEHIKRPKMQMENEQEDQKADSPPMPVIDVVFSLAPYQAYLQGPGVLSPNSVPQGPILSSDHGEVKTKTDIKEKMQDPQKQKPVEKPVTKSSDPKYIKVEKKALVIDCEENSFSHMDCRKVEVKKELEDTGSSNCALMLVIKKCESDELENKPTLGERNESSEETKAGERTPQRSSSPQGHTGKLQEQLPVLQSNTVTPPQPQEYRLAFRNIPPQCLNLPTHKFVFHQTKPACPIPTPERSDAQPTSECIPKLDVQMPVRKHFFELHQDLYKLISACISVSSEQKLRTWLTQLELTLTASPSTKDLRVSCLLGVKAREVWLNEEIKSALHTLLDRLREYTVHEHCPFPHVMRTRAVFLPMLVLKELLFPMVQGSFIDQVLHEHKVELRPTTLSEERILIQIFKRSCSSRLMRLMSLKHLPDIYADVVNLLYYTCVCKHLGLDMDHLYPRVKEEACEDTISRSNAFSDIAASPASPEMHAPRCPTEPGTKLNLKRNRKKSRVKSSSRRMFLDSSLSDEEKADDTAHACVLNTVENLSHHQSEGTKSGGKELDVEQDTSVTSLSTTSENSWTCPLTLEELSSFHSEPEREETSGQWLVSQSSGPAKSTARSRNCSSVILKLRKMFSKGLDGKKTRHQETSGSRSRADLSLSKTDDDEGHASSDHRTPIATQQWQRTGSFCHALRPRRRCSKRKHKSLSKIKYCPYLGACHSAERRRRWVLRSAVQRVYPDLVGKRIHHLYEEDDKSEVWYRGEVLRVHEANTNPLKTVYEVRYDSELEWKYYLELLIDFKKGWLKIED